MTLQACQDAEVNSKDKETHAKLALVLRESDVLAVHHKQKTYICLFAFSLSGQAEAASTACSPSV